MYRIVRNDCCKWLILRSLNKRNYKTKQDGNNQSGGFGVGKFIVVVSPFVAVGGAIAYANYDKNFRKTLGDNIPGAEYVLKMILDDGKGTKMVTKTFSDVTSSIKGVIGSTDTKVKEEFPKIDVIGSKKENIVVQDTPALPKITSPVISQVQPSASKPVDMEQTANTIPTNLAELELAIEVSAKVAVDMYTKAISTLKNYNEDVKRVVDDAIENSNLSAWNILRNKTGAKNTVLENAEKEARSALLKMEKCENALSKAVDVVNQEYLISLRGKIKTLRDHINTVKDELYKYKDSSTLSEKYWKNVENARNYYIDEIEAIFPGLILSEKKLNLSGEELDLFLIHTYSHVLTYQKELHRLQAEGDLRLKHVVDSIRGDDNAETIKSQLSYELEKEKRNLVLENQKKINKLRFELERDLRQQLKRQAEAHVDHLNDALKQKESELKRNFSKELDEKLSTEKASYKLQLASMLGKLKGMDAALKARAESERCAHQAQALWAACQALWASVRTGEPGIHWSEKLRPLKNEIDAVNKAAANGDELVAVVLKSLPREVEERGVYPEDALRERFLVVEKTARKLALVPEDGASLPLYILSYIQSVLLMRPKDPVSHDELQNVHFDFSKLDTYDILNRARYYIDRGDLTLTVKYMNLLQGAPRKISIDWIKEARLLLETQQAANTLMAHAAASGLLYL